MVAFLLISFITLAVMGIMHLYLGSFDEALEPGESELWSNHELGKLSGPSPPEDEVQAIESPHTKLSTQIIVQKPEYEWMKWTPITSATPPQTLSEKHPLCYAPNLNKDASAD
jgi:hypothetical protein